MTINKDSVLETQGNLVYRSTLSVSSLTTLDQFIMSNPKFN